MKVWCYIRQNIRKEGRKHDYDVYKNNHSITPIQVENVFNLGYCGVQNDFPNVTSVLPFRKKMNNDLSKEKKIYNKKQSQLRIIAEHTICRIKKFGIMWLQKTKRVEYHEEIYYRNYAIDLLTLHPDCRSGSNDGKCC